jgi:hypothetical protein
MFGAWAVSGHPTGIEAVVIRKRAALLSEREKLVTSRATLDRRILDIDRALRDCAATERLFGIVSPEEAPTHRDGPLREIIAAQLSPVAGKKVREIREFLRKSHGEEFHEKTVGMTLYRLMKAGLARREGRLWFATPSPEISHERE